MRRRTRTNKKKMIMLEKIIMKMKILMTIMMIMMTKKHWVACMDGVVFYRSPLTAVHIFTESFRETASQKTY